MSLRDELPCKASDTVNFSRIDHAEHDKINQQINEFIARGGGITEVPAGASSENNVHPPHEGDFAGHEWDNRTKNPKSNKKMKTDKPTNDFGDW